MIISAPRLSNQSISKRTSEDGSHGQMCSNSGQQNTKSPALSLAGAALFRELGAEPELCLRLLGTQGS